MADGVAEKKLLWRYMPLAGLLRLLQTRKLHMARADGFEDLLEGQFAFETIKRHLGLNLPFPNERILERFKSECFLSCWHLASSESLAMWRLYGRGDSSVAIVSNVGAVMNFADQFCSNLDYCGMFGDVVYDKYIVDGKFAASTIGLPFGYRELPIPLSALLFFCKAREFEYEREWRLLIWRKGAAERSIQLPVSEINEFVDKILVSPEAPDWIVEAIREVVHSQFGLGDIVIERSRIATHLNREGRTR